MILILINMALMLTHDILSGLVSSYLELEQITSSSALNTIRAIPPEKTEIKDSAILTINRDPTNCYKILINDGYFHKPRLAGVTSFKVCKENTALDILYIFPEYRGMSISRTLFNYLQNEYEKPVILFSSGTSKEYYERLSYSDKITRAKSNKYTFSEPLYEKYPAPADLHPKHALEMWKKEAAVTTAELLLLLNNTQGLASMV